MFVQKYHLHVTYSNIIYDAKLFVCPLIQSNVEGILEDLMDDDIGINYGDRR